MTLEQWKDEVGRIPRERNAGFNESDIQVKSSMNFTPKVGSQALSPDHSLGLQERGASNL